MSKLGFMPGSIDKEIPPGANDPSIVPVGVALHVAVYEGDSLEGIFKNRNGIESHFYVRYDGRIEQYRSIYREADAQTEGNSFMYEGVRAGMVSVETEGHGPGLWTPNQLSAIRMIISWVHLQNNFPRQVCPAWNKPGIGYHSLFDEWNPASKSCPGPERIKQFYGNIVPWFTREYNTMSPARRFVTTVLGACTEGLRNVPKNRVVFRRGIVSIRTIARQLDKIVKD